MHIKFKVRSHSSADVCHGEMFVSALVPCLACLVLLMCQAEVGRNQHFKSVSKGQQEMQTVWILTGRRWRASFACPLNEGSAARVFRNAFHFGSISARLCPAGLGLGKDCVYAVEKPVLSPSAALLLAPSGLVCSLCGLCPTGLHRCNF